MNINILGINELKWTGMGEFNSDDHYIYYCGQESLRRNGVAIMVNNRVRNAVLGCNLKNDRMISVCFQGKPFNITVIQVYAPISNVKEAEQFCEDLQNLLELTPKKDMTLKDELPRLVDVHLLLEISGEITPERMKGWSQRKNNTQLGMGLVMKAGLNAVKGNIA